MTEFRFQRKIWLLLFLCFISGATAKAQGWPAAPVKLAADCNSDGTVTLSWTAVAGADAYALRLNNQSNDSASCLDGWYCSDPPDRIENNLAATKFVSRITGNQSYGFWVHALRAGAYGEAQSGAFICPATLVEAKPPWELRDDELGHKYVVITDQQRLDQHLRGIWAQWLATMATGQVEKAVEYISTEMRWQYARSFAPENMTIGYDQIPAYYGEITWDRPVCSAGTVCKPYGPFIDYTRVRARGGRTVVRFRLEQDQKIPEGVWRIDTVG